MGQFLTNPKLTISPAGPIAPSTFVTIDGTQGDNLCRQATATTDHAIGVSQVGQDVAPGLQQLFPNVSVTPEAGQPGAQIGIFTAGDVAPITAGAGGWTPGALIGIEAGTGNGISVTAGSGTLYFGIALSSANQGELVEILLQPPIKA